MHAQPVDFGQKCQFVLHAQPPRVHWHDELRLGACGSIVSYVISSFPTLSCWILFGTPGKFLKFFWIRVCPLCFHLEPRDSAGYVMLDFMKPLRTPVPVQYLGYPSTHQKKSSARFGRTSSESRVDGLTQKCPAIINGSGGKT